uniref:WH2 domain-containing protein n=1 Tax=Strigops habroptila TaxID=2489341 RepID=A0A672TGQ9_STRHB
MSDFALEETLEADWVAVRPHAFQEREKQKFVFIMAWNEIEGKFAIACHNRKAQWPRQLGGQSRPQGRHPYAEQRPGLRPGTRLLTFPCRGGAAGPLRGPEVAGVAEEKIEVLGKEEKVASSLPPSPLHAAESAAPDAEPVGEECSWAGLFSFQDLRAVHQQLCLVNSELEPYLPAFPEESSGVWMVLFSAPELSEQEMDALCYKLQVYLLHSLDICGWKILSQVLFTETDDPEEYYESLSELRRKGYEEVLQWACRRIQELLEKHKNMESMVELLELYQMEDEACSSLVEATRELYQYLLQPFRDMRELAMLRRQQIKISVENDFLGPRRIESLQKEDADWQRKAHMAVLSIQDLTVKYFEITSKAQKAVYDCMRADQKKFGKAAWAAAVERMEKLQYEVSKETLQLMRAKEICLEQKKHALKEEMQSLKGGTEAIVHLDPLEADYYDIQLQLYEVQFEILKCEELLVTTQLESMRRLMSEKRDEVVYYDTYESMEAMLEKEDMATSVYLQKEELQKLQQKICQLEARHGRISAKKAYLRNKKEICIAKHNEKSQQHHQSEEEYKMYHTVQIWYPGQVMLKSTKLQLAHARRKCATSSVFCVDQPYSLPATIQTQEKSEEVELENAVQPLQVQEPTSLEQLQDISLLPNGITSELPHVSISPLTSNEFQPETVTIVPLPPPLPPPPPPLLPPLPSKEDDTKSLEKSDSFVKHQSEEKGVQHSSSVPIAHLFDSTQLVSAKKKLKKTSDLEGLHRRRVSSPMDEVVASLKHGSFHLRKVEQRSLPPFPNEDDSNNILAQIRRGVKLKKVQKDVLRESFTVLPNTDPLTRTSPESEDEEESLPCADWEN